MILLGCFAGLYVISAIVTASPADENPSTQEAVPTIGRTTVAITTASTAPMTAAAPTVSAAVPAVATTMVTAAAPAVATTTERAHGLAVKWCKFASLQILSHNGLVAGLRCGLFKRKSGNRCQERAR